MVDEDDACFVRDQHAMLGEKCVFMLYKEVVVG